MLIWLADYLSQYFGSFGVVKYITVRTVMGALTSLGISFIFGPLRESAMGTRIVTGVIIGFAFTFVQKLLSPASLVYGFSPIIATLGPIVVCFVVGYFLFRRAR